MHHDEQWSACGSNASGILGTGNTIDYDTFTALHSSLQSTYSNISNSGCHVIASTNDDLMYIWGEAQNQPTECDLILRQEVSEPNEAPGISVYKIIPGEPAVIAG